MMSLKTLCVRCEVSVIITACSILIFVGACATRTAVTPLLDHEGIDTFIESQMEVLNIPGLSLAIIEAGEVSYVQTYGLADVESERPVRADTLFETASLSKPVFAYFALRQVDRGVVDLDQPLAEVLPLPELDDPRSVLMTTRMVLTHQTGLPNWRWFNDDRRLDIKFDPGTSFGYSGEGFEYLALVLADRLNTDIVGLESAIRSDLASVLAEDPGYWVWNDVVQDKVASGYNDGVRKDPWKIDKVITSASLHMNAKQYAEFLVAAMGGRGLAPQTAAQVFQKHVVLPEQDSFRADFGLDAWGLGFAIKDTSLGKAVTHGGVNDGFTSWFTVFEVSGTGYVFLTNSESGPALNQTFEPFFIELLADG